MLSIVLGRGRALQQAFEMPVEALSQDRVRDFRGIDSSHDDEIPARQVWLLPEGFAGQPLQAIAIDGALGGSAGDRKPQSRHADSARTRKHREEAVARPHGLGEYSTELSRCIEASRERERSIRRQRRAKPIDQGVNRARPLARLAFRTLRPPRVAIRARKPCVRLRRKLLGWNVLFIAARTFVAKRSNKNN
jgi:hypothetical protein